MIPEAVHDGGDKIGLGTLCGFLAALIVSLIPMGGEVMTWWQRNVIY